MAQALSVQVSTNHFEIELSAVLGRKADLNTAGFISRYYRAQVIAEAEVMYVAA